MFPGVLETLVQEGRRGRIRASKRSARTAGMWTLSSLLVKPSSPLEKSRLKDALPYRLFTAWI